MSSSLSNEHNYISKIVSGPRVASALPSPHSSQTNIQDTS
ncbi:unnamed protein product [Penicillium camemberti]|uniref:Str. FM013 n=1 Tax=Penicillium camemberti (strain FM 013) TaxID=1429867 RepID=A0A0G4PXC4_PENC3|nr:unnamed protein product [Penicillium camemberti]